MTPLLPPRTFQTAADRGSVYHHGAHVVEWTPAGQEPVIWLSQSTRLDARSAIRGGIPVCWPWFGAGRRGVASPLHGFARLTEWRLVRTVESKEAVTVTFLLIDAHQDKFGSPYRMTYEVSFGREFSARLTVKNTGVHRFSFEEALHTYFRVGDVRQVTVSGLDQAEYLDKATGHEVGPHRQSGDVTITGETDRIYQTMNDITIVDPSLNRRITMSRLGSQNAVVWNPWIEKSRVMPDFGDDEWTEMICVETANVGEHEIILNPGKEHVMGFTLAVSPLTAAMPAI